MKRSEIIDLIAEQLQSFDIRLDYSISWYKPEAKIILEVIEKAGMAPPRYVGLMANGKKYNKEVDFGRDIEDIYGWEPEE